MDTNIVMDFEKTDIFPSIQTVTFVGINVHRFIWAKHAHHLPFLE